MWALRDSNPGPTDYESAALTTELRAPETSDKLKFILDKMTMKLQNLTWNKVEYCKLHF